MLVAWTAGWLSLFIALYTLSVAFYMPTIALANTTAFTILKKNGLDTVKDFPPIRVLGTVGFIITMWFVNCACWEDGSFSLTLAESAHKFQYTYMQFFVSGLPGREFRSECLQTLQDPEDGFVLHLLRPLRYVSAGDQRLCRPLYHEFQG